MFSRDEEGNITMHRGDTGSFKVNAERASGDDWTSADRMLFTIKDGQGDIVLQRIYRLDDQWGLGNGVVLIEFHNDDTDTWANGSYQVERRYNINPRWDGTAPTGRCVNGLTSAAKMIEGDIVRTVFQGTLTINDVCGEV